VEDAIWRLDATAQAELVRSGAVSAVELVEAALARADELAELHAVTVLFGDRALSRAAEVSGPFAGVPILLKDAGQELAGTPMWMGSTVLKEANYISTATTELAAQLEALGFLVIGKTAVPELMTGITTEPPIGPPTQNPWARDRTVGGSSGGSGAAVAAGIVAIAHGSDSSGSLRFPASCCGVLTLKPSAGRISSRFPGGVPDPCNRHTDFVFARSSRDLRRIFASLAPAPNTTMGPIRRVALLEASPFGLSVEPAVEQALDDVAGDLTHLGLSVDYISPKFLEDYGTVADSAVPTIADAHRAAMVDWIEVQIKRPVTVGDLSTTSLEAAERGRRLDPQAIHNATVAFTDAARAAASWTNQFDALLIPILDVVPWQNGTPGPTSHLGGLVCSLANLSGQPSTVIPTVHRGLPVGVQLQAPLGHDEALIDLLHAIRPTAPSSPYMNS
jgi:amidase